MEVRHGWGMTETTAVATMSNLSRADRRGEARPPSNTPSWPSKVKLGLRASRSRSWMKTDVTLPRDGVIARRADGAWPVDRLERYFKAEKTRRCVDGWFPTGDIATIDRTTALMQIRDRTKDVIKTGGEWISSIDLENAADGRTPLWPWPPSLASSIPKWDERPLLFIVRKPGQAVEKRRDPRLPRPLKWPSGGCPTTWSSSTRCRSAAPARSRRRTCASSTAGCSADRADASVKATPPRPAPQRL